MSDKKDSGGRQVFRSPSAVVVWWLWVLFALGNLIDLAVQGRDHVSLVAAFILLFVTGIVYVTALRPRIIVADDGLTVANPVRDHQVDWAAIVGADPTDLLRIRCEWPEATGTAHRAIYSWAVHSSRRRQVAAEMRARRRIGQASRGGFGSAAGMGGFGLSGAFGSAEPSPEGDPLRVDTNRVIATLTEHAEQARLEAPGTPAAPPVSTWDRTAVLAIVLPGLALVIVALV